MKIHILILILFVFMTCLFTYPLLLNMSKAVLESGDSLFVTWTIAWDIKALLTDPLNIFHANIFYPYKYTLAYSEHMIGVAVLALPLYLFTKNILFIYNFMLLLSFVLCGWGMYLLVYNLFKNRISGIISGIIFAFCPFRFDQLGHLHVLTCQWMPFALIFLHKIIEGKNRKIFLNLCFWFFCCLQFLSSGHNGLYLILIVLLFLIYFRKEAGVDPFIALVFVGICLIPFYLPYIKLSKELGLNRSLDEFKLYSPQLISYLGVSGKNFIYGKFLSKFGKPEAIMFPGFIAIILVFYPLLRKIHINKLKINIFGLAGFLNIIIIVCLGLIFFVAINGGIDLKQSIFGIKLKISDFTRPVYIILLLFFIKGLLRWGNLKKYIKNIWHEITCNKSLIKFYYLLCFIGLILSFGPVIRFMDKDVIWGPYSLLYAYFPGFSGLRVSGRIYNVFILAFAVLAGFGWKCLIENFKIKNCFYWILPFLISIEYINIPLTIECFIGTNPSPVYKWIAEQKEDFSIVELPMPEYYDMLPQEIEYMYWSTFHWKKMLNGYSGYSPPAYWPMAEKMKDFPDIETIEILKYLGIKYVVIHETNFKSWKFPSPIFEINEYNDSLKLVFRNGSDYIYEVLGKSLSNFEKGQYEKLPEKDWSITANCEPEDIYAAIDNDYETRWQSGAAQQAGMQIILDLGKEEKISGISMYFGKAHNDYPRGIEIEVSSNLKAWSKVTLEYLYANYVKHLIQYPKDKCMFIGFSPETARYIRITETKYNNVFFWSIYEIDIYREVN